MASLSRWIVRIAALALVVWAFLPQVGPPGGARSLVALLGESAGGKSPVERLGLAAWLLLPAATGVALLAATTSRADPGPVLRGFVLALLMAVSFATATAGSLVLTHSGSGATGPQPSFPLALLLFLVPLILGGTALARLVGGNAARSSGGFARLSLGVLIALHGLFLIDAGWELALPLMKTGVPPRVAAGAWLLPAAGLAVAVGEFLNHRRPRAAVDSAPASG